MSLSGFFAFSIYSALLLTNLVFLSSFSIVQLHFCILKSLSSTYSGLPTVNWQLSLLLLLSKSEDKKLAKKSKKLLLKEKKHISLHLFLRAISSAGSEHLPYKQGVISSNLISPTRQIKPSRRVGFFLLETMQA